MLLKVFFIILLFLSSAYSRAVVLGGCPRAFHSSYSKRMTIGELKEMVKNEIAYLEHAFTLLARKFSGDFKPQQIDAIAVNVQSRISSLDKQVYDLIDEKMQKIAKEVFPPGFPNSVPSEKIALYHENMTEKASFLIRDISETMRLIENLREDVSDVTQAAFSTHNLFTLEQAKLIITYIEHTIFSYSTSLASLSGEAKLKSAIAKSPQSEWLTNSAFFRYSPLTTTALNTEMPTSKTKIQNEIRHIEEQLQHIHERLGETLWMWQKTRSAHRHNLLVSPPLSSGSSSPRPSFIATKEGKEEYKMALHRHLSSQFASTGKHSMDSRDEMMGNLMREYNFTRFPSIVVEIILLQQETAMRKDEDSLQKRLGSLQEQLTQRKRKRGRPRKSADAHSTDTTANINQ